MNAGGFCNEAARECGTSSTSPHPAISWKMLWDTGPALLTASAPCTRVHTASAPCTRIHTASTPCACLHRDEPHLEGLELALHLLTEALAVLSELPLLGGLGSRILQPSFQLRRSRATFYKTVPAPREATVEEIQGVSVQTALPALTAGCRLSSTLTGTAGYDL